MAAVTVLEAVLGTVSAPESPPERILYLFAGRARMCDVSKYLRKIQASRIFGILVRFEITEVDLARDSECDLLDEDMRQSILEDMFLGSFIWSCAPRPAACSPRLLIKVVCLSSVWQFFAQAPRLGRAASLSDVCLNIPKI